MMSTDMDEIEEVIFTSAASEKKCEVYDLKTCNLITEFKDGSSGPHGLVTVADQYVMSSILDRPVLKWWTMSIKGKKEGKVRCPGIVQALAVSNDGCFCVFGIQNRIYVWEVKTGYLLASIQPHYRDITCVAFSLNDYFVTGAEDGVVMVWLLKDVISLLKDDKSKTKSDFCWVHRSAITGVCFGSLDMHIASTSYDMECKIYDLNSKQLVYDIYMGEPLTALAMDSTEQHLVLGTLNGNIYRIDLKTYHECGIHYSQVPRRNKIKAHGDRITSLSISNMSIELLSGSEDRTCKIWNFRNLLFLRKIDFKGPVLNAFISEVPAALLNNNPIAPSFKITEFRKRREGEEIYFAETTTSSTPLTLFHENSSHDAYPDIAENAFCGDLSQDFSSLKAKIKVLEQSNKQLYCNAVSSIFASGAEEIENGEALQW